MIVRLAESQMLKTFISLAVGLLASHLVVAMSGRLAVADVVVLRDASVFDSATGQMLPHRTIVLSGELITAVGSPEQPIDLPSDARIIDCAGQFVIPGLDRCARTFGSFRGSGPCDGR